MKKGFFFTNFNLTDFPEIQKLWEITGMGNPERGDNALTILNCIDRGGKFICLREKAENRIVGTSWISNDGRRLFLHHFCIHPDLQGKGLGYALGRESMNFIRESRMQVKLEVHKDNFKAKKLYEKLGFQAFRDYDIYMIRKFED